MDACAIPKPQALLARVGDTLMQHLLLHTAIFLPLAGGSDNFLQVTGRPIAEVGNSSTRRNPYCLGTASWPCISELRVAYVSLAAGSSLRTHCCTEPLGLLEPVYVLLMQSVGPCSVASSCRPSS